MTLFLGLTLGCENHNQGFMFDPIYLVNQDQRPSNGKKIKKDCLSNRMIQLHRTSQTVELFGKNS